MFEKTNFHFHGDRQTNASWWSRLPNLRLNDRRWGLTLVVQRPGKAGLLTFATVLVPTPQVSKYSVIQRIDQPPF